VTCVVSIRPHLAAGDQSGRGVTPA
jgi:hypothetical protein